MSEKSVAEATAKLVIAEKGKEYLDAYFGFAVCEEVCLQLAGYVYGGLIESGFTVENGKGEGHA